MPLKVAALYQFVALPDFRELKMPLFALCETLGIKGTLLLASEGINGTIAGTDDAIDTLLNEIQSDSLFADRLDNLQLKFSTSAEMPFRRLKVRLKKEIVRLGKGPIDPNKQVGTYVEPSDWDALIAEPGVVIVDTRNHFEVEMGSFQGAIDPHTASFGEFPNFVAAKLADAKQKKIAMFCTGGIRCEKASAYLLAEGFEQVFHLKGGILKYLETIPAETSLWRGECFVFDERVALGHGLEEREPAGDDKQ